MNKILIVKPSFDNGNIGDLALINTIQKLYIKGKSTHEKIRIIGYKIDNNPRYTVLLKL